MCGLGNQGTQSMVIKWLKWKQTDNSGRGEVNEDAPAETGDSVPNSKTEDKAQL